MATKEELRTRVIELESARVQATVLYKITRGLNAARDENDLLKLLARPAIDVGASGASLVYIELDEAGEPKQGQVVAGWQRGDTPLSMPLGTRYNLPEFPFFHLLIAKPRQPLLITNINTDERIDEKTREFMGQMDAQAMVIIPLTQATRHQHENSAKWRWIGLLISTWGEPHHYSPEEEEIYKMISGLAAPTVENRRLIDNLEQMVEDRTTELLAAEAKFRQIVERVQVGIFRTTADGQVVEANPTLLKIHKFNSLEEMNKVGVKNLYVNPSRRKELFQLLQKERQVTGFEADLRCKDGTIIQTSISAQLVTDKTSQLTFLEGILEDITGRKRAEAERERLQQEIIEAQQRAIQELSTPVIPVMDRIIIMPLVGSIDSMRAKDIMRTLLAGIREHRAKVIILDITGVAIVDSGVAGHLDKTIQAARLKGARTIITGISDAVAETIVDLGINWSEITTLSNLQTGLRVALAEVGLRIT